MGLQGLILPFHLISFSPYFRLAFRLASASVSDSVLTGD